MTRADQTAAIAVHSYHSTALLPAVSAIDMLQNSFLLLHGFAF